MSVARMLLVAVAIMAAIGAVGCGGSATPVATVQRFLETAVINTDGQTACTYLTERSRAELERQRHAGCDDVFGAAALTLAGPGPITTDAIDDLHYSDSGDGQRRIVTVDGPAGRHRFTLRRANSVEANEFQPPDSDWRIDSDVAFLVPV